MIIHEINLKLKQIINWLYHNLGQIVNAKIEWIYLKISSFNEISYKLFFHAIIGNNQSCM